MVLIGSAYPGSDQKTFHSLPCLVFFTSEGREPKALLKQAAVAGKWPWVYAGPFDSLLCGGVFHVVRGLKCCIPGCESSLRKRHLVNVVDKWWIFTSQV